MDLPHRLGPGLKILLSDAVIRPFCRDIPVFRRVPARAVLREVRMEFWGRDIPCVGRKVCSIRGQQKGGAEWSEEGFFAPMPLSAEPIGFPSKGRWRRQPTDEVASFLLHDAMAVTDNKARLLCHQAAAKIRAPPHPPHSRSAPSPRGEGFACSFSQPQPTQKTAGRTMRPAVPG